MTEAEAQRLEVGKYAARLAALYEGRHMNAPDPFRKEHRQLSPADLARIDELKTKASELYEILSRVEGREGSISRTKLEESVMWGVKGMTG